jgi:hypothetical protein
MEKSSDKLDLTIVATANDHKTALVGVFWPFSLPTRDEIPLRVFRKIYRLEAEER